MRTRQGILPGTTEGILEIDEQARRCKKSEPRPMIRDLCQEGRIPGTEGFVRAGIQGRQVQEKADLENQGLGNRQVGKVVLPQEQLAEKNYRTGYFTLFPFFFFLRSTGLVT